MTFGPLTIIHAAMTRRAERNRADDPFGIEASLAERRAARPARRRAALQGREA